MRILNSLSPVARAARPCISLILLALLTTACDRQSSAPAPAAPAAAIPASIFVSESPAGAKNVAIVVKETKDGDEVIVRGRIGGRAEPFVADRAVIQLIDSSIKACTENPGDSCAKPWDMCCEPADTIAANSVSIQVIDTDGRPLKTGLKGIGGLQPLSTVTVKGKAVRPAGSKAVTINATALHVAAKP